jgi:penicillin-binding protein 2
MRCERPSDDQPEGFVIPKRWFEKDVIKKAVLLSAISAILLYTLASCQVAPLSLRGEPTATPTPALPGLEEAALGFLESWERTDYKGMYALLSPPSQAEINQVEFVQYHHDVAAEMTMTALETELVSLLQDGPQAQAAYRLIMDTVLVGRIEADNLMSLSYADGRWGVNWSPGLIFRELEGGNILRMFRHAPSRGNIYDRYGTGLAIEDQAVTVGIVPGQIEDEDRLLAELSWILGLYAASIKEKYALARPDWYVPIGDLSFEASQVHYSTLSSLPGVVLRDKWVRAYRNGSLAAHLLGYMGRIEQDERAEWVAKGYSGDELVGKASLERWGEPYLVGQRGGTLVVLTPAGRQLATIKEQPASQSRSIYTTLDQRLQQVAEATLGDERGAIVALDPNTGQILAMASRPTFDPNMFVTGMDSERWQALVSDASRPLVNRATQGTYPPGSVFKIVTMAAALEEGELTPGSTFNCPGIWYGLGQDLPMTCWLERGHGQVDLVQALTVSCDVTFYELGKRLYELDPNLLPRYARLFGLGAPIGLEVAEEVAGLVPDHDWKIAELGEGWFLGDSVNLAIGQGYLLVTPLQVATMVGAVGNGGTLYRPQLVLKVSASSEEPEQVFEPQELGRLPLKPETLSAIQEGLLGVATSPGGTAYQAFEGMDVAVAGKTGTAENPDGDPHAWFAGYAPAEDPQIAMVVLIENGGEGSQVAAPLFRQVVEAFFAPQQGEEVLEGTPG